jgi:hypothetical protein
MLDRSPMRYLRRVPREAPAGRVVVHNVVRPARVLGDRGFRAWTVPESELAAGRLEACDCGWPFDWCLRHYRPKIDAAAKDAAERPPAGRGRRLKGGR